MQRSVIWRYFVEKCISLRNPWAMINAITKQFPDSARQRCVVHKMDNVLSYVPTKQQEQLKPELKALFYQRDRQAADQAVAAFIQKYQQIYPIAIACLQRDLEACLTFYAFPKEHWKTIRTLMYNPARFSREEQRNRTRSIHNASYLVILRIIDNIQ